MKSQDRRDLGVAGIRASPLNSFSDPILHLQILAICVKQIVQRILVNRSSEFPIVAQVASVASSFERRGGKVETNRSDIQVRPRLSNSPENRIEFRPGTARHGANSNGITGTKTSANDLQDG